MFRTALTFAGYDVKEARDGLSALNSIEQYPPTAVVLDLGLPHVSGYVVLQDLVAQAHTRHIPVIIVTGKADTEPAGASCLLHKPVEPDRLVDCVRDCILSGSAGAQMKAAE